MAKIPRCSFSNDLKKSLSALLDADYGLLERLRDVLTNKQYQSLRDCKPHERNDELMKIVNQLPQDSFLEALRETGQQHIVNVIEFKKSNKGKTSLLSAAFKKRSIAEEVSAGNENETCWPLTDTQLRILTSNQYLLANIIEIGSLLPTLFASKCITHLHREYIESKATAYERNVCLIEIMLKRSQADYRSFICALDETGQNHVANILTDGGGVAALRAVLAEPKLDDEVETKFKQWSKGTSREELLQKLNKWLGPDLKLVDIRKGSSVAVYFLCKTLPAIQRLDTMRKDGTLKSVLGEIFSTLLEGRHVEITELDFYESSNKTCLHFFHSCEGVNGKCSVCYNQQSVPKVKAQQLQCSSAINNLGLPLEMFEIVLVKGVVLSFKHQMKISSDADNLAILTVSMVCRHWHYILGSRPFILTQIRRTLDHVSRPLRRRIGSCDKRLLVTEEDDTISDVRSVATLDNRLFVVCNNSSTVSVFDLTSLTRQQNLELKGLSENPSDIATCEITQRIYISDGRNKCVWHVNWSSKSSSSSRPTAVDSDDSSPAVKFINCDGYRPWTLSTSGRRQQLLVTGYSSNWWYVYDVDGKLLRHVKLPEKSGDVDVEWHCTLHAVQSTTDDSYFVCRHGSHQHVEVAEYNSEGQRLRCYYSGLRGNGPRQVNYAVYMTSIGDGRLLLADSGGTGRVLLLNSELELERILLARQASNPERLCYDSKSGLLFVVMNSGTVRVNRMC